MSLLFTEDVDFRICDRTQYKNRGEFCQHYANAFAKMRAGRRHATTMTFRRITAELAVIDGVVTASDEADPSYQIRHYHYTALRGANSGVSYALLQLRLTEVFRPGAWCGAQFRDGNGERLGRGSASHVKP